MNPQFPLKWFCIFLFFVLSACTPEITASIVPPTPTLDPVTLGAFIPEGEVHIRRLEPKVEVVNNCGVTESIIQHPSKSALLSSVVTWEVNGQTGTGVTIGGGPVPAAIDLTESLGTYLSNAIEQSTGVEMGWDLPGKPGHISEFTLMWSTVWQPGYIEANFPGQGSQRIDVFILTDIKSEIADSSETPCPNEGNSTPDIALDPPSATVIPEPTSTLPAVPPTQVPTVLVSSPVPTVASATSTPGFRTFNESDVDTLFGAGNWACLPGYSTGLSISNLEAGFVIRYPIIEIHNRQGEYKEGDIVPSGGLATAWLISGFPSGKCASVQIEITRTEIDSVLGAGNWYCLDHWPNGLGVWDVPDPFFVQYPLGNMDKDDHRYELNQVVPSGGPATAWLQNELSRSECP